jgi:2-iminoacetate synthase ThiH
MSLHAVADFQLDDAGLRSLLADACRRATTSAVETALERAGTGRGLDPEDVALLWSAPQLSADALCQLAYAVRRDHPVRLETFSPLYLTNTCDAECRMCGMRSDNRALVRQTADADAIEVQLHTLRRRGMHAVALLTGEYRATQRSWAMAFANRALRRTQALGFRHVLLNVGSVDGHEFDALLDGIPRRADGAVEPKLTLCTFQETYSRPQYAKFMGTTTDNPRADYDRRLANFDRGWRAGLRVANPGILVGLNPDIGFELLALVLHARHLQGRGMEVYLSVPRLRQIAGSHQQRGAADETFVRLVSVLSLALPTGKIVLTTRESSAIQRQLVPIVTVLSAGSAAVAPYTDTGAHFPLETSQFEVVDQRPFEDVLAEWQGPGGIENFEPGAGALLDHADSNSPG